MSSMLKKTGGLSFKPKAGRRPGAGAASSKPPASTTSTSTSSAPTTRAPTTEPPSQASTPAASTPSTSAVVDSIETTVQLGNDEPVATELPPTPAALPTPSSASEPHTEIPAVQPYPTSNLPASPPPPPPPTSPPVAQIPTPQPSNEVVCESASRPETPRPATDRPRHDDAQSTSSSEAENSPASTTDTSSRPSAATPAGAPESSAPGREATPGPPTAPSSLPCVSTAAATSLPSESTEPRPPAPKKQATRRRKSTATDGGAGSEASAPKKKRQRTKSSTRTTAEAGEGAGTEDSSKPVRRRKRAPTPENAEELTVDHSTMTVGELTKDLGIGKRFRHAEEIEQRAREARAKYRLKKLEREKRKLGLLPPEDDVQPDASNENGESRGAAMAQLGASMDAGAGQGVGYDVVDGQIVVHAASLIVNRHNQDMSNLEEIEENDFTNLVNSSSFAKRVQAPGNWTDEETEKFYRLLGMFGTDFETISRLFPGKNRRAIKLKFNKEERLRPNRVNAAMMVRGQKKVNIDLEEYKASQRQWQAKDKILAEHAQLAQEHEREVARLREERRAAGLIDDEDQGAAAAGKQTTTTAADGANAGANGEFEVIEEDADALGQQQQQQGADVHIDAQPAEGIQT
ncbi:hypothetical protein F4860DRAFT_492417 [Xylaria cubensis]|nr:hypothetical protein F4860DRAFT_492417 [Xylaria cubensis]